MSQNGKSVDSNLYMQYGSCKMLAHARSRAVQPPAQPRLVACLGLIARLQLLLQLPHQHVHQVFLDNLYRARLERGRRGRSDSEQGVGVEARLAELWTKMVKIWHVIEFFFLEW